MSCQMMYASEWLATHVYKLLNIFAIAWTRKVRCSKKHLHRVSNTIVYYQYFHLFSETKNAARYTFMGMALDSKPCLYVHLYQ